MAIIHRIGTPENDSEARAIKRFAKDLPDDCFVFHNFEVTTEPKRSLRPVTLHRSPDRPMLPPGSRTGRTAAARTSAR